MRGAMVPAALAVALAAVGLASCGKPKTSEAPAEKSAVALPSSAGLSLEGRLAAIGTEPFWRLEIAPEGLVFSTPEGPDVKAPFVAPSPDEAGASLASGKIKLRLIVQPCSDGMSEAAYPMRAEVDVAGVGAFKGCAYARWDNELEALIPAIDACLGETTEPSPVVYAIQTANGAIVRMAGVEDGERYDCEVDSGGGASVAASEAPPAPGERDPTFVRAPADEPLKACAAVEMKGRDGALLGWEMKPGAC